MKKLVEGEVSSKRLTLGAVAACLMLAALDQTIVTTALPKIVDDLGSLEQLSWVMTSYLFTSTISAPIYGKLGDVWGRKIMMQIAIIIFVFSSLLAAIAQNMSWLLCARAAQGLGGGGLFVLAFTVVGDIIPSRERGKVQGLFAAVFGLSSIVGPLLGGFFVDEFSWHWIFLINLPIGIIALTILYVSPSKHLPTESFSPDYFGIAFLSLTIGSLIFLSSMASSGSSLNHLSFKLLGSVCLVSFVLFIIAELKTKDAIVPMHLFKINNFWVYSAIGLISSCILLSVLTFVPFYLQIAKDYTPTKSGVQIVALTAGIIFGAMISGIIMTKTGKYKFLPLFGGMCLTFGLILMTSIKETTSSQILTFYLGIVGLGLGPQLTVTTTAIQNSAPPKHMGVATSTLTLLRQIGASIGVACLTWLFIVKYREYLFSNEGLKGVKSGKEMSLQSISSIPESERIIIQAALNNGIQSVFFFITMLSIMIIILSLFVKELKLKTRVNS